MTDNTINTPPSRPSLPIGGSGALDKKSDTSRAGSIFGLAKDTQVISVAPSKETVEKFDAQIKHIANNTSHSTQGSGRSQDDAQGLSETTPHFKGSDNSKTKKIKKKTGPLAQWNDNKLVWMRANPKSATVKSVATLGIAGLYYLAHYVTHRVFRGNTPPDQTNTVDKVAPGSLFFQTQQGANNTCGMHAINAFFGEKKIGIRDIVKAQKQCDGTRREHFPRFRTRDAEVITKALENTDQKTSRTYITFERPNSLCPEPVTPDQKAFVDKWVVDNQRTGMAQHDPKDRRSASGLAGRGDGASLEDQGRVAAKLSQSTNPDKGDVSNSNKTDYAAIVNAPDIREQINRDYAEHALKQQLKPLLSQLDVKSGVDRCLVNFGGDINDTSGRSTGGGHWVAFRKDNAGNWHILDSRHAIENAQNGTQPIKSPIDFIKERQKAGNFQVEILIPEPAQAAPEKVAKPVVGTQSSIDQRFNPDDLGALGPSSISQQPDPVTGLRQLLPSGRRFFQNLSSTIVNDQRKQSLSTELHTMLNAADSDEQATKALEALALVEGLFEDLERICNMTEIEEWLDVDATLDRQAAGYREALHALQAAGYDGGVSLELEEYATVIDAAREKLPTIL